MNITPKSRQLLLIMVTLERIRLTPLEGDERASNIPEIHGPLPTGPSSVATVERNYKRYAGGGVVDALKGIRLHLPSPRRAHWNSND